MAIRIVFNLKGKGVGDVKIKNAAGSDLEKRTVQIGELVNATVDKAYAQNMNNSALNGGGTAGRIKTKTGWEPQQDLRNVEIVCKDEREAEKLRQLLHLKISMVGKKNNGDADGDAHFRFWIENIIYDETKTFSATDFESFVKIDTHAITLNTGNTNTDTEGNGFNGLDNVKISNVVLADATAPALVADQNYDGQRNKLKEVWVEIDKLHKHFIEDGNVNIEDNLISDTATSAYSVLRKLKVDSATANSPADFVYDKTAAVKNEVDDWIRIGDDFKLWKEVGVDNVDDILRANANGFILSERAATSANANIGAKGKALGRIDPTDATNGQPNITHIKNVIKAGKYRGFNVFSSTQTVQAIGTWPTTPGAGTAPAATDKHKVFNGRAAISSLDPANRFECIDKFTGEDWFDADYDSTKSIQHYRGLKINDFRSPNEGGIVSGHGTQSFHAGTTKNANDFKLYDGTSEVGNADNKSTYLCLVAHAAPDLDSVINLIFFGQTYFKDNSKFLKLWEGGSIDTDRWDKKRYKLFANEVVGLNELQHVQLYYNYVLTKDLGHGGTDAYVYNTTTDTLTGGPDWKANSPLNKTGTAATDPRGKLKAAYDVTKTFLDLYMATKAKSGSSDAETGKTQLEAYNISGTPTAGSEDEMKQKLYKCWKDKIDAITTTPTSDPVKDAKNAAKAKHGEAGYVDIWEDTGFATKEEVEKAEALVVIIKDALKADTDDKKRKAKKDLGDYKNKADNTTEKKVWGIVDKYGQENSKGLATRAWEAVEKVKDKPSDLETARQNLKTEIGKITGVTTDKVEEIFNKISEGLNTSELNKAVQILQEIKKVEGKDANSIEAQTAKGNLAEFRKNTKVWDAVNKYQPSGEGYASAAFKKLDKPTQDATKILSAIGFNSTSVNKVSEVDRLENEAKKQPGYKDSETKLTKVFSRLRVAARIDEKSDEKREEKEFAKKVREFVDINDVDIASLYGNTDKDGLKKLQDAKKVLDKYESYKTLTNDDKEVIKKLISEIDAKIKNMKEEQKDKENPDNGDKTGEPKKSIWTHPMMIVGYFLVAAAILGAIVWFMRKGDNAETEEGEE